MSSFVFNNFKKRFIEGSVPLQDEWTFYPVSNVLKTDIENNTVFESVKTKDDIEKITGKQIEDYNPIESTVFYNYSKYDSEDSATPEFINYSNFDKFLKSNLYNLMNSKFKKGSYDNSLKDYLLLEYPFLDINGNFKHDGFYLIKTEEDLNWFANLVNTTNNNSNALLVDNIESKKLSFPIGVSENMPFEGIFDGLGNIFKNCTIEAKNCNNGIFGVIGINGVVKNISVKYTKDSIFADCKKRINLKHIKETGSDVNVGFIAGKNFGTIRNIIFQSDTDKSLEYTGFVPEVYSVSNKADSYSDFKSTRSKFQTNNENFYYLNSFCINSPANLCPYVGFFNAGVYASNAIIKDDDTDALSFKNRRIKIVGGVDGDLTNADTYEENTFKAWESYKENANTAKNDTEKKIFNFISDSFKKISGMETWVLKKVNYDDSGKLEYFNYLQTPGSSEWKIYTRKDYLEDLEKIDDNLKTYTSFKALEDDHEYYVYLEQLTEKYNQSVYKYDKDKCTMQPYLNSVLYYEPCRVKKDGTVISINRKDSDYFKSANYFGVDHTGVFTVQETVDTINYNANLHHINAEKLDTNFNLFKKDPYDYQGGIYEVKDKDKDQVSLLDSNSRVAYCVSPICGYNAGRIQQVNVIGTISNKSNFVGFFGGIAGKQVRGDVSYCNVELNIKNTYNWKKIAGPSENSENKFVWYKNTPVLPEVLKTNWVDAYDERVSSIMNKFYEDKTENNRASTCPNTNKDEYIDEYCSCYELNPIYVQGGLFGILNISTYSDICYTNILTNNKIATNVFKCNTNFIISDIFESEDKKIHKHIFNTNGAIAGYCYDSIIDTVKKETENNQGINISNCNAYIAEKGKDCDNKRLFGRIFEYTYSTITNTFNNNFDNIKVFAPNNNENYDYNYTTYYLTEIIAKNADENATSFTKPYLTNIQTNMEYGNFNSENYNKNLLKLNNVKTNATYFSQYVERFAPNVGFKNYYEHLYRDDYSNMCYSYNPSLIKSNELNILNERNKIFISDNIGETKNDKVIFNSSLIFNEDNEKLSDAYFNYTYETTTSGKINKITKDVVFTSAIKGKNTGEITTYSALGYVFNDATKNVSGGDENNTFKYLNNYIHLGCSYSPLQIKSYLNTQEETAEKLASIKNSTNVLKAMQIINEIQNNIYSSPSGINASNFGGMLVTDSNGNNVMYIENTGTTEFNGGSWNYETNFVTGVSSTTDAKGNTTSSPFSGGLLIQVE